MRFLCLPGAYGSADKFQVQLSPVLKELTEDGSATFYFTQGPCKAVPPPGFEDYFGPEPHYRFIEPDKIDNSWAKKPESDDESEEDEDVLTRIRDFPQCETAEDTMRELMRAEGLASAHQSVNQAIRYLVDIMNKHGPFDGIIGYSEGATVAATLLLYEQRRVERQGPGASSMFKYAIFFAGWPPLDPTTHALVLSDESEEKIEIRTLHIVGSMDPYIDGSMALFNVCEPDTAYLFDHGKGHMLPRDRETIKELGDIIRTAIADIDEEMDL